MRTSNPDHPVRKTLKHLALASTMGAALYFGAAPANATPVTTDLALWLDASDASTMTLSDTTVTEWRDKNGSAAKMTLQAGAPALEASGIGGIPTVRFNTSSRMNDGVNHAPPVTIFYVSRQTGGANNRVLSSTNNNWLLGYWAGNKGSAYFDGDVFLGGNGASDTNPHLYAVTIPGSGQNSTVWAEGSQIASNQGGTTGPNNLQLNGYQGNNELSDCEISEVLVYHRILDSSEMEAVGGYLAARYALVTSYGPPVVVSSSPPDDGTVGNTADLLLTFSKPMAIGTGDITIKNLTDATQTVITLPDSQVTVSGTVLRINPTSDLVAGKNYAVQISAGAVKDLADTPFAGILDDETWNFTTIVSLPPPPSAAGHGRHDRLAAGRRCGHERFKPGPVGWCRHFCQAVE